MKEKKPDLNINYIICDECGNELAVKESHIKGLTAKDSVEVECGCGHTQSQSLSYPPWAEILEESDKK